MKSFFFVFFLLGFSQLSYSVDFVQKYEKGKLLLKKKYYFDAIKEFHQAIQSTDKGKTSFGAHFYLAKAYYWLPDIEKAMEVMLKAQSLIKNNAQKKALVLLASQIRTLYSSVEITPEVDPEEVGKLQLELEAKGVFSHKHKTRYFGLFSKRLKERGGLSLDGKKFFLPKGEYFVKLKKPQCLKYALLKDNQVLQEFSVEDAGVTLSLKGLPSCQCSGGQKRVVEGKKVLCACPSGTGWNKEKKRCEVVKRSKWPWIVAGVGGALLIGGGIAATVIVIQNQNDSIPGAVKDGSGNVSVDRIKGFTP